MERWRGASRSLSLIAACSPRVLWNGGYIQRRQIVTSSPVSKSSMQEVRISSPLQDISTQLPPLSVMPTGILIRSLLMTYVLSSPRLVELGLPLMAKVCHKEAWFLNPDRNLILGALLRKLIYDHFCAGENEQEIKETISTMKSMGFEGVILGYAKEVVVDKSATAEEAARLGNNVPIPENAVTDWKLGNLRTLSMLDKGDFLAIKLTGGGSAVTESLALGKKPSALIMSSLKQICNQAAQQGTRIWIDAEQTVFQPAIDAWTTELMRTYNYHGRILVYNTFQAYLKETPRNIAKHLNLAQKEGWALGIKLVRGAYIASEPRHLIHDAIEDTHAAYDAIVQSLLTKNFPEVKEMPDVQLMLASHNSASVKRGFETWRTRRERGLPTIKLEIGQLQGMADEISCELVQKRQQLAGQEDSNYPRAFKCLCWGSVQQCIHFLMRRVIENKGSLERTNLWMTGLKRELWRRMKGAKRG